MKIETEHFNDLEEIAKNCIKSKREEKEMLNKAIDVLTNKNLNNSKNMKLFLLFFIFIIIVISILVIILICNVKALPELTIPIYLFCCILLIALLAYLFYK